MSERRGCQLIGISIVLPIRSDRTESRRPLWSLTVEDEYTRERLTVVAGQNLPSSRVQEVIESLIAERGVPEYLRSDNGPEFIVVELTE